MRIRCRVPGRRRAPRAHRHSSAHQCARPATGAALRPSVHLNGHFDVVPAGDGWTVDPFGGLVGDGRIYGRGSCDMKAGIAAALFAVEGIRRADVPLAGSIEISGTVDEESGGFAGVAWLAEHGRLTARTIDYVIIPEPLHVDRICLGHRGVYWFEVLTRGRIAHGSMPFLGVSAIDHMGLVLDRIQRELLPRLAARTTASRSCPRRAPRDDQRQRHRRRPAGGRHPDAVRRRSLPCGVRSPLPARGRVRRDQARDRGAARAGRRRHARLPLRAARSDGRPSGAHSRGLAGRDGARAARGGILGRPASSSPALARTITSTWPGSPASSTASPTALASSIWRISRTSSAASTTWSTRPK